VITMNCAQLITLVVMILCPLIMGAPTPVVLMHGITADNGTMSHVVSLLQQHIPGIYVKAPNLGGWWDSIFTGMDEMVDKFCSELKADPNLQGGINLIGFSQGGPVTRGYLERCNNPPVKNYVGWVSPQGGVYGVPKVGHIKYLNWTLDDLADCCVYDDWVQDLISWAGYWRDPYELSNYEQNCKFLPDIDNARSAKNPTYKTNVLSLKNFIMSYSLVDETLIPPQTGWFGVYAPNQEYNVVPLEERRIWTEDWIGLKTLNATGRLHRFTTECSHGDYSSSCFDKYFMENVFPYLN